MADPSLVRLEMALMLALSPNPDPRKEQALQLCNQFRASPQSWRSCVQLLTSATQDSVKFFCLQTLQQQLKYGAIPPENRAILRQALLQFVKIKSNTQYASLPIHVKNKFAIVLVLLMKSDLLSTWNSAFDDIRCFLTLGESATHLWIRTLYYIDEEVVKPTNAGEAELVYCSRFKDYMREQVLRMLVENWLKLLEQCDVVETPNNQHLLARAIAKSCLKMISVYIPWIDVSFSANPRFLKILQVYIKHPQTCHATLMCLRSLVEKGMPPLQKLKILQGLNRGQFFASHVMPLKNPIIAAHAATFFAAAGAVVLGFFRKKSRQQLAAQIDFCRKLLSDLIHLSLPFLKYKDPRGISVIDVTKAVLPFFKDVQKLSKTEEWIAQFDEGILVGVFQCYRYPPGHDFSHPDDVYADFFDFRKELEMVFAAQAASRCGTIVAWLSRAIFPNRQRMSSLPFSDAEALLELVAHFDARAVASSEDFRKLVLVLCESDISAHAHRVVILAYIEMVLRYPAVICQSAAAIKAVMSSLLSARGMRHPRYKTVRSRSCYCLRKLLFSMSVTSKKPYCEHLLHKLVPVAASAAREYFGYAAGGAVRAEGALVERDYMSIFEIVGSLTAMLDNKGKITQLIVIDTTLMPMMKHLHQRSIEIARRAPNQRSLDAGQAAWASRVLLALSNFIKGYPSGLMIGVSVPDRATLVPSAGNEGSMAQQKAVINRFINFLNVSTEALALSPQVDDLRRHCMSLVHTLLDRTGSICLPNVKQVLHLLMQHDRRSAMGGPDTTDVLQLLHDAALKLGTDFIPYLTDAFLPMLHWFGQSLGKFDDPQLADVALKSFVVLLHGIFERNVWPGIVPDNNIAQFPALLERLLVSAVQKVEVGKKVLELVSVMANVVYGAAAGKPVISQRGRTASSGDSRGISGRSRSRSIDRMTGDPMAAVLVDKLQAPGQKLAPVLLDFIIRRLIPTVFKMISSPPPPLLPRHIASDPTAAAAAAAAMRGRSDYVATDAISNLFLREFIEVQFTTPRRTMPALCSSIRMLVPSTVAEQYITALNTGSEQSPGRNEVKANAAKLLKRLLRKLQPPLQQSL